MSEFQTSEFIGLMQKRYAMCQSLLELSLQQDQFIETDNYTALVEILGKKQQVLGQLDSMNQKHPALKEQWLKHRDQIPQNSRVECDKMLANVEEVLSKLMQHEEQATNSLVKRRDETQKKLNDIATGTQVNEEYRDNLAPATHRHLDVGL